MKASDPGVFAMRGNARSFACQHGMPTWDEVAAKWNAMSGQNITRNRVQQIAAVAEQKFRQALLSEFKDLGAKR